MTEARNFAEQLNGWLWHWRLPWYANRGMRIQVTWAIWNVNTLLNAFTFPVTLELYLPLQVLLNNGSRSAGCRSWCRGTADPILSLRVVLQTGSICSPPLNTQLWLEHFNCTSEAHLSVSVSPETGLWIESMHSEQGWGDTDFRNAFLVTLKCVWTPPSVPSRGALCRAVPQPRAKHIWRGVLLNIGGDARMWLPIMTAPLKLLLG